MFLFSFFTVAFVPSGRHYCKSVFYIDFSILTCGSVLPSILFLIISFLSLCIPVSSFCVLNLSILIYLVTHRTSFYHKYILLRQYSFLSYHWTGVFYIIWHRIIDVSVMCFFCIFDSPLGAGCCNIRLFPFITFTHCISHYHIICIYHLLCFINCILIFYPLHVLFTSTVLKCHWILIFIVRSYNVLLLCHSHYKYRLF